MNLTPYRVRRATLEDIRSLKALWRSMSFPDSDLEKRLTDFQIAENPDGQLLGAVGFEILGREGRIHHEAFDDFALADQLRPLLWDRIQSLATNHGLFRLWTQERAPFWNHIGLRPATGESLQNLPEPWRQAQGDWIAVQLRDDAAIAAISLDKEFALFKETERARTERAFQQARALKLVATLLAAVVALIVIGLLFYFFLKNPRALGR